MSWSQAKTSTILKVAITWSGMKRENADGSQSSSSRSFLQAARAKSIELNALKAGLLIPTDAAAAPEPARLTMNAAIDDYLEYIRKHRSLRTYRTYRPVLNVLFRNSYTKTYVDEVTREDILKFTSDCFDRGLVPTDSLRPPRYSAPALQAARIQGAGGNERLAELC